MPLSPRFWVSLVRAVASAVWVGVRRAGFALGATVAVGAVLVPVGWDERAAAAGGEEKVRPHELVGLRDARSTTKVTADGSLVTRLSRQSVHWFDRAEGVWRDIDTKLAESSKAGVGWVSGSNRFTVEVAERSKDAAAGLVTISGGEGGGFSLGLEGATVGKAAAKSADNAVVFGDLRPGVDLEYVVLPDGVKENIVLRSAVAPSSYAFRLTPANGEKWRAERLEESDLWMFFVDGSAEPGFVLLPPSVGDSAGAVGGAAGKTGGAPAVVDTVAGKASLDVKAADDGSFVATVQVDEKWLGDPARVFPVVVDPTVYSQPDVADAWYDTTNGGNPVFETLLKLGANGSGAPTQMSVATFDIGSIPLGAKVVDAKVNAYLDSCFPGSCDTGKWGSLRLRRLTGGWSGGTPWSSVATHIDATTLDTVDYPSGTAPTVGWQTWTSGPLTSAIQGMVNGSSANYGFILDKSAGSATAGYALRSSMWTDANFAPYLDVTWVSDGVQVTPAATMHSDGAELRWQHFPGGTSAYVDSVLTDSPVGYWRLGDAAGATTALDWTGNGNTAAVAGGVTFGVAGNLADLDTAAQFNGSTGTASATGIGFANQSFTVEAWARRNSSGTDDHILGQGTGALRQGLHFGFRASNVFTCGFWQDNLNTVATYTDTNWHHWACTYDASTNARAIYRDGTLVASDTAGGDYAGSGAITLGIAPPAGSYFDGTIDEAVVYPAALSGTRVLAHYNAASVAMPGFKRYEIHRSASAGFTPSAATLVATLKDVALQTYRDTTAKAASTFYYEVVTVTDEGGESVFSSNELKAVLPAAGQATMVQQPGYLDSVAKATHISSGSPTTNYGNSQTLVVGSSGSNTTRTLLQFDLRSVPTGVTVSSAEIQLYALQSTIGSALKTHRMTAEWQEGGATWNQRDNNIALNWGTAGGDFDATVLGSGAGGLLPHWESIPVTAAVQAWVDASQPQLGLMVKYGSESGSQPTQNFAADGFVRSVALRPKLVITYQDGSAPAAPTVAVAQPQPGELVKGTVTLSAGALDDGRVTQVEFFDGATPIGSPDTTPPYEVSWVTSGRGSSSLTAKATDEAGNITTSAAVAVTRANSSAPTATISSATAGGAGVWTVNATATDDVLVSNVEFFVDGERFAADGSSPYSATLSTLSFPVYDGSHDLTVRSYDADGNVTTSSVTSITVDNTTDFEATISATGVPLQLTYDPSLGTQLASPISVTVTNTGVFHLAVATMKLRYRWYDLAGTANTPAPADVTIPGPALATGDSATFDLSLAPPTLPTGVERARYRLQLDIYDQTRTQTFSSLGSQPFERWLTVTKLVDSELGLERYQMYDGDDLGGGLESSVNVGNGNSVVQWTPLSQPGRGIDTVLSLTYNSLEHGSVSPLGNNWSLAVSSLTPFGLPLDIHPNTADTAAGRTDKWVGLTDADGSYHRFTGNAAGTYYTPPAGVQLYLKKTGSTGWELWKPDRTRFVYDAAGFPSKVADANGNELSFTLATPAAGDDPYGLGKRVSTVTDAGGRSFTLAYWAKADVAKPAMRGLLKSITDHVGHKLELTYYEDGNLRSVTEKGGPGDDGMPTADRTVVFAYTDTAGSGPAIATLAGRQNPFPGTSQSPKLFSVIDFKGQEAQYEYATSGTNKWRVTGRTNRLGTGSDKTSFAYPTSTTATVTRPLSRVWGYTLDSQARVTQISDPLSQTSQVQWTTAVPLNQVARVTQPTGKYVEYAYNANGYRTSEKDELGNETAYTYANTAIDANDASGNWETGRSIGHVSDLASVTKPRGVATTGNPTDYKWTFTYTQTPTDSTTGLVKTITDPLGNVTSNTWNANATLATQTLPSNGDAITRTTTFNSYDANGLPTKITDAAGGVSEASYRADGLPLLERDPVHAKVAAASDQDSTKHYYDAFGRERRSSSPKSEALTPGLLGWASRSFDANDNTVSEQAGHYGRGDGSNGATTGYTLDALDRVTTQTGPRTAATEGGPTATKTEYDAGGRATRVTLPKGVNTTPSGSAYLNDYVTETAYDLLDRPTMITEYAVDGSGNVDSGKTRVTKHCYDQAGDLRSTTAPKGSGGLSSCPNPAAVPYVYTSATHTTKFEYDDAHRQTKVTDPAGKTTQTGYDENGAVTSQTDQLGKVITSSYNDRGDRVSQVVPFDTGRDLTSKWEYDNLGNLKRLISPRAYDTASGGPTFTDYVESYAYDALNQPTKVTLPAASGTPQAYIHNSYDADGRLAWTSLPTTSSTPGSVTAAEKTENTYWDSGQIYSTVDPTSPKVRYDYTGEGWQSARIPEKRGQTGVLDYNRAMYWVYLGDGLLKSLRDEGGEHAKYLYDADGNRTNATEAIGLVHVGQQPLPIDFAYDSLDQLTKTRTPKPSSSNYLATYLSYDQHGNTATLEDNREETSGGSSVTAGRVMTYTYNNLDQATGQVDDFASAGTTDDEQLLYTYTDRGELDTRTLQKGGTGAWTTEQSAARSYFWNGQLKTLTNKNAAAAMVEQHTLSYIASGIYLNGNRASDVYQLKGPDAAASCYSATCTASWTYDARDRLTQEVNGTGSTTSFTVDTVGNVTSETTGTATTSRTFTGQQLATETVAGTTVKYLYDNYSNQDCKVKSAYSGTSCPTSGSNLLEDWVYDYKNRLAGYRSYNGSGTLVNTVDYVNDALDRPVSQSSTVSGSTTNYTYTYLGATDLLSKEVLTGATSATRKYAYDAQGRRATLTDGANRYSYHYDPHGSVSLLLDQTGAPKASYGYSAYGNPNSALTKTAAGFSSSANAYRYTGKRTDTASATLDMGARRYTPTTGRFLQADYYNGALANLGLSLNPLSNNRYALAGGNPVNYVEIDGHYVIALDPETGENVPLVNPSTGTPFNGGQPPSPSPPVSELGIGLPGLPSLELPSWLSPSAWWDVLNSERCSSLVRGGLDEWLDPQCFLAAFQADRQTLGRLCDRAEIVCAIIGPRGGKGGRANVRTPSPKQIRHYEEQLTVHGEGSLYRSARSEVKQIEKHLDDVLNQLSEGQKISNSIRDLRKHINELQAVLSVLRKAGK